jgi:hypothetical protein
MTDGHCSTSGRCPSGVVAGTGGDHLVDTDDLQQVPDRGLRLTGRSRLPRFERLDWR